MEQKRISKDCEVEVSSEEEGFEGAWFRAILEENPTNSRRKKLRIRYLTLLDKDGSSPLIKHIDQRFIRPVQPDNMHNDLVFEEGTMIDVDHKEGWWVGIVIKKMEEDDNYLVYFDSPPDILLFKRKHLRTHLNWSDSTWVRPDIIKELHKSMFSSGTMVEVKYVKDGVEVAWFPAMIVKEIEVDGQKIFIVKKWNKYLSCNGKAAKPNTIIDSRCVRPTPPPCPVDRYSLMDRVEAFHGSWWYQGRVKGVLLDKRYRICLEPTKKEYDFKHSELRPFMVWEDGIWHYDPKLKPIKKTPSNVIQRKSMRSSSGANPMTPEMATMRLKSPLNPEEIDKTHTKAGTVEATAELGMKRADAVMNDISPPVIITQATLIGKESFTPVTPSPVITATPLQQLEAEIVVKKSPKKRPLAPMKNGLENSSTRQEMPEEENSKEKYRKRKREEQHKRDLNQTDEACSGSMVEINDTELSSNHTPNVVDNSAADVQETTQANHTFKIFPFAKNLPFWKTYETEEVYKTVPQYPHFSPLFEANEYIREWSAVGMMVSFYGLLEEVRGLQLNVSPSKLSSLRISFAELEKHGFDVATAQSRINKVFFLQDKRSKKAEEIKCIEKKIEAEEMEKHKLEEEMVELKRKILELKRQETVAKEHTESVEKLIVEMKSCAETVEQEIESVEHEFITSVLAPW